LSVLISRRRDGDGGDELLLYPHTIFITFDLFPSCSQSASASGLHWKRNLLNLPIHVIFITPSRPQFLFLVINYSRIKHISNDVDANKWSNNARKELEFFHYHLLTVRNWKDAYAQIENIEFTDG
jgi:hypothetical protein